MQCHDDGEVDVCWLRVFVGIFHGVWQNIKEDLFEPILISLDYSAVDKVLVSHWHIYIFNLQSIVQNLQHLLDTLHNVKGLDLLEKLLILVGEHCII